MKIADIEDPIADFVKSQQRNAYIYVGVYRIYIRKGIHHINGRIRKTLDLGNIQNEDNADNLDWLPTSQRGERGRFSEIIRRFEEVAKTAGFEGVFVESVVNGFLPEVLTRYGYKRVEDAEADVHYFKPV